MEYKFYSQKITDSHSVVLNYFRNLDDFSRNTPSCEESENRRSFMKITEDLEVPFLLKCSCGKEDEPYYNVSLNQNPFDSWIQTQQINTPRICRNYKELKNGERVNFAFCKYCNNQDFITLFSGEKKKVLHSVNYFDNDETYTMSVIYSDYFFSSPRILKLYHEEDTSESFENRKKYNSGYRVYKEKIFNCDYKIHKKKFIVRMTYNKNNGFMYFIDKHSKRKITNITFISNFNNTSFLYVKETLYSHYDRFIDQCYFIAGVDRSKAQQYFENSENFRFLRYPFLINLDFNFIFISSFQRKRLNLLDRHETDKQKIYKALFSKYSTRIHNILLEIKKNDSQYLELTIISSIASIFPYVDSLYFCEKILKIIYLKCSRAYITGSIPEESVKFFNKIFKSNPLMIYYFLIKDSSFFSNMQNLKSLLQILKKEKKTYQFDINKFDLNKPSFLYEITEDIHKLSQNSFYQEPQKKFKTSSFKYEGYTKNLKIQIPRTLDEYKFYLYFFNSYLPYCVDSKFARKDLPFFILKKLKDNYVPIGMFTIKNKRVEEIEFIRKLTTNNYYEKETVITAKEKKEFLSYLDQKKIRYEANSHFIDTINSKPSLNEDYFFENFSNHLQKNHYLKKRNIDADGDIFDDELPFIF